jgi:hypothetical protein
MPPGSAPSPHLLFVEPGGGEPALGSLAADRLALTNRIPEERRHVELGLAEHRLRVDRQVPMAGAEDVVVREVAVDQHRATDLERHAEFAGERYEPRSRSRGGFGVVSTGG